MSRACSKANQIRFAESREAEQRATLQDAGEWAMQQVALAYDELDFGFSQFDATVAQQQAARTAFDANVEAFRRDEGTVTSAESAAAALD